MDKSTDFFSAGIKHCRWMRSWNCCKISKGSASQGLRALRQFGAVSSTFAPGDRKERFLAEIRLRKLVSGFLREQADPHLEKGVARLKQIEGLLEGSSSKDSISGEQEGMRFYQAGTGK